MIIQPFIFGNVDDDLGSEFAELESWVASFLGQPNSIDGHDHAVLASVATAHVYSDSRLFSDGYHLQTLLNMIDSSYPFLFFIIGDNYGQSYINLKHGKGEQNVNVSVDLGHQWLLNKKVRNGSLLHLLIHYAAQKTSPGHAKDFDEEGKPSPFIYIRRPTYERSVLLMTDDGRFAHQRAPAILADAAKLDSLKREILSNNLKLRFFDSPKQLINLVLADLQRLLKRANQLIIKGPSLIRTPTMNQLSDEITNRIDYGSQNHAEDSGKIVALVAEPRSGKHQLISSWVESFSESNPGVPVAIFHANADAASPEINSVVYLMHEAIKKFRSFHYEFDRTLKGGRVLECLEARQLHQIEQEFGAALALGPCLLVIMGLDSVTSGRYFGTGSEVKVKQLHWIPEPLPANCRIIVSTTSNDMTLKALLDRKDVEVLDVSGLSQDPVFKQSFLRNETVAYSKFPQHLIHSILASPTSSSVIHLAAISRILANQSMLQRLEYQVECLLELTRLRDLFSHEVRKWLGGNTTPSVNISLTATPTESAEEEIDRGTSWIPVFLRFMVLSRKGLPTRSIMPMLKLVMGIKKSSQNYKVVERWLCFWQSASYIFAAGPHNTLKLITDGVRRSLAVVLFDSKANSFSVWRRRYVRFLQSLPNAANDPVVLDELLIQADQGDDFPTLLRLLSDGRLFARLVNGSGSEVFALSLLVRIEANLNGSFRYLVARWMDSLGILTENVLGDSTARSEKSVSQLSDQAQLDSLTLPDGHLERCEFAWLISDWLFAITKVSPSDSDYIITVNAFANLIPMVAKYCEETLDKAEEFSPEARSSLGGFLMRCSLRFAAPRFNNMKLALEMQQHAARLFHQTNEYLNSKNRSELSEIAKTSASIDELDRLVENVERTQLLEFHKIVRYSFICCQLECCEMSFKLGNLESARYSMSAVEPYFHSFGGQPTWPPIICRHLFCLSLFSQSSTNAEQCERYLRAAADVSTKWYGRKHPAVADTLLALGCILASRATMPRLDGRATSARSSRGSRPPTAAAEGLQQVFDTLFTSEEVEHSFRESIAILEERRLSAGGDTERLSFACASLGRYLSHLPTSSAKREAVELLQKAADLSLLETGHEDYTVKWLRSLTKDTLLAMPPAWYSQLRQQQQLEDSAVELPSRPFSSRLRDYVHHRRVLSAATFTGEQGFGRKIRPATTQTAIHTISSRTAPDISSKLQLRSNNKGKQRPKTSIGIPKEYSD